MHWGKYIIIVYSVFVGLILFMVFKSLHQNFDLVNDDYYEAELKFQDQIDAAKNAAVFTDSILVSENGDQVQLQFPSVFANNTTGQVHFYKASNAKQDVITGLSLNAEGTQAFDKKQFASGFYTVKLNWTKDNILYYAEKNIVL